MRDMARRIEVLAASKEVRAELRRRANGRSTEHRDRLRAEIILLPSTTPRRLCEDI